MLPRTSSNAVGGIKTWNFLAPDDEKKDACSSTMFDFGALYKTSQTDHVTSICLEFALVWLNLRLPFTVVDVVIMAVVVVFVVVVVVAVVVIVVALVEVVVDVVVVWLM